MPNRIFCYEKWEDFENRRNIFLGVFKSFFTGKKVYIKIMTDEEVRSYEQNSKLWPMLEDLVKAKIKFNGKELKKEEWKKIFVSAVNNIVDGTVPNFQIGLEGEWVDLNGTSSRALSKKKFSMMIENIYAYGSEKGVLWSEPNLKFYDEIMRNSK